MKTIFNAKEAAKLVAERTGKPFSVRTLQGEIKNGFLEGTLIGHSYIVSLEAIERYQRRPVGARRQSNRQKTKV